MTQQLRLPVRSPWPAYFALFAVCMALFGASVMVSCSKNQRIETLKATLVSVNAASDGFVAWDHQHQQTIVNTATSLEQGQHAFAAYRDRRQAIVDGLKVTYQAIAVAATQMDEPSLNAALAQAAALIASIKKLAEEF